MADEPKCPFRMVGFTPAAAEFPRDELALIMLAAFNNVPPATLTEGMRYFPNESTKAAWTRVADAARQRLAIGLLGLEPSTGDATKDKMLIELWLLATLPAKYGKVVIPDSEYRKLHALAREKEMQDWGDSQNG